MAPFMDRDKVTKATAQIGFIKFVLIPMFETVTKVSDHRHALGDTTDSEKHGSAQPCTHMHTLHAHSHTRPHAHTRVHVNCSCLPDTPPEGPLHLNINPPRTLLPPPRRPSRLLLLLQHTPRTSSPWRPPLSGPPLPGSREQPVFAPLTFTLGRTSSGVPISISPTPPSTRLSPG